MRTVARWVVAPVCLALLAAATVVALQLHSRSAEGGDRTAVERAGRRLHDLSTSLSGSALPPDRRSCERYALMDEQRNGYLYPVRDSAEWNAVIAVCVNGGR